MHTPFVRFPQQHVTQPITQPISASWEAQPITNAPINYAQPGKAGHMEQQQLQVACVYVHPWSRSFIDCDSSSSSSSCSCSNSKCSAIPMRMRMKKMRSNCRTSNLCLLARSYSVPEAPVVIVFPLCITQFSTTSMVQVLWAKMKQLLQNQLP